MNMGTALDAGREQEKKVAKHFRSGDDLKWNAIS